MAVLRNDSQAASEQYAAAKSVLTGMMIPFNFYLGRLLGLLAQMMDNLDLAADHFEEALACCRKAGYRPELAWTC
jgi:hypothetical protein